MNHWQTGLPIEEFMGASPFRFGDSSEKKRVRDQRGGGSGPMSALADVYPG